MEIINKNVTLRELIPTEREWLTEAKENVSNRTFVRKIYIGSEEDTSNWREASDEEKLAYEEAEEARIAAELAEYEAQMSNN